MRCATRLVPTCFAGIGIAAAMVFISVPPARADVTFSTFVSSSSINAVEGQNSTIAFTYAGNKFVGSVYFGPNNNQLYSTDLNGGNVQAFGAPIPGATGEVVVGASLGKAGFGTGDIYAGSGSNTQIYRISNDGSSESLFTTLPTGGDIRQIFFDPGNSFSGAMIVTTASGDIYTVDSAGTATLLASTHEDTEGLDIAPSNWGPYAGQLLVASEGSGLLRFISPAGVVTSTGISVPAAETVSFVPQNLGDSGNPLEGFYVANYAVDVQKADASQFTSYKGDAIITSEDGSNARVWDVHYDGTNIVLNQTPIGHLPNQSEDGIFVTAERLIDLNPAPEPASIVSWFVLGTMAIAVAARRRRRDAS